MSLMFQFFFSVDCWQDIHMISFERQLISFFGIFKQNNNFFHMRLWTMKSVWHSKKMRWFHSLCCCNIYQLFYWVRRLSDLSQTVKVCKPYTQNEYQVKRQFKLAIKLNSLESKWTSWATQSKYICIFNGFNVYLNWPLELQANEEENIQTEKNPLRMSKEHIFSLHFSLYS